MHRISPRRFVGGAAGLEERRDEDEEVVAVDPVAGSDQVALPPGGDRIARDLHVCVDEPIELVLERRGIPKLRRCSDPKVPLRHRPPSDRGLQHLAPFLEGVLLLAATRASA